VPLKALNPDEERVFRKICTRREQIAGEIARIQEQLLKGVEPYRLAQDGWRSHYSRPPGRERRKPSRDEEEGEFAGVPSSDQNKCHKPVNNVRDKREGEL
jgi:regulator of RNase E activity RraB